ncbi:hypothetical protein Tsp_10303 [Trichinella spiralis]|uniref:hypothetical protein n=1 Tax=Trichinella spiralis TaxID=6334 RepID=UPI0001EFE1D0|nr:hypothetical protein Tsp_10303 [Trichinella spiralis]
MNSRFESFTPGLLGRYPIARFIFICNIPHFVDIWNTSTNRQLATARITVLYVSNCSDRLISIKSVFRVYGFSRKLPNFMGYRLVAFAKIGESPFSETFTMITDNVMQSSIRNYPIVVE